MATLIQSAREFERLMDVDMLKSSGIPKDITATIFMR